MVVLASVGSLWLVAAVLGGSALLVFISSFIVVLGPLAILANTVEASLGLNYRGQVRRLSTFDATQPLSVGEIVRMKVGVVLCVTMLGYLAFFGGLIGIALCYDFGGIVQRTFSDIRDLGGMAMVLWASAVFALFAALSATGTTLAMSFGYGISSVFKRPVLLCIFVEVLLFPVLCPVLEYITGWNLGLASRLCLVASGGILIGVAIWSLRRAVLEGHYERRFVYGFSVGWILLLALLLGLLLDAGADIPITQLHGAVFAAGLCSIPLASAAWAPMALASARNQ